jgi:hypothetical protein
MSSTVNKWNFEQGNIESYAGIIHEIKTKKKSENLSYIADILLILHGVSANKPIHFSKNQKYFYSLISFSF